MAPTRGAPVVDRRDIGPTRAQDDPLARRLLRGLRGRALVLGLDGHTLL